MEGEDPVAANIMCNGLKLDFIEGLEPSLSSELKEEWIVKGEQAVRLSPFVKEWYQDGLIGRLELPDIPPSWFSRLFTVPKDEDKWRPIIDLSKLNKKIMKKFFRMEDLKKISKIIHPGLWGVKLDLKDAYHHIPLAREIWKFFRFAILIDGKIEVFFFKVLPFGLTTAPWAFSRVLKPIKKELRLLGITITSYLDDFLILARSRQEALDQTQIVIDVLQRYGFNINWEKTSLEPLRVLDYLGVTLDLVNQTFSLPKEKVSRILAYCTMGRKAQFLTRRDLEKLVGYLNFAAQYLKLGRLFLKPIQAWMEKNTSVWNRDQRVPSNKELREALVPWADPDFLSTPIPMKPRAFNMTLMTDASEDAWGGILQPQKATAAWPIEWQGMSMNWKELKAIHMSIQVFQERLRGQCVRVLSDNMTALACLRREGSLASEALWFLSMELLTFAQEQEISLVPVHLKGKLNVLADQASRNRLISTEWRLDPHSFRRCCLRLGEPQIDLFATIENTQLPLFISPCPDERAEACDALNQDWNRWSSVYLFPPVQLLGEILDPLRKFTGKGFLIAPFWPTAIWFLELEKRCLSRFLLPEDHFLFQEKEGVTFYHKYPSVFRLHVWTL